MEIRIIGKEYFKETLDLFNRVFKRSEDEAFWENKHYNNPVGNSVFVGMFDGEELIAINAFSPMEYIYKDEKYRVLQSCESAVDDRYRKQGIFSKLIIFAEKWASDNGYDFLIGMPNIYSYPGFVKLGWKVVSSKEVYARIVDYKAWKERKKVIGRRPLADALMTWNYCINLVGSGLTDVEIKQLSHEEFIELGCFKNDKIYCNYTREYLDWKMDSAGNFWKINNSKSTVVVGLYNGIIVFFDAKDSSDDDCIALMKYFCKKNPMKKIMLTSSELYLRGSEDIAKKCRFISKREAPAYIIAKPVSDRAAAISETEWGIRSLEGV